ncbi:hypothetical protein FVE85_3602 [Porphyridium purpureum]|uniref:Uncharacterized protein n=1 Tax=Porphyridium purpureum TaxID=35688 RepID=A0A5J4YN87_PORPP|nr:hypothetical protein FVE85_3602 [Porphyridium purpureum]|eukprot:POR6277..scf249_10
MLARWYWPLLVRKHIADTPRWIRAHATSHGKREIEQAGPLDVGVEVWPAQPQDSVPCASASGWGDEDDLLGPFFAIRRGVDKFRGVVVREGEFRCLLRRDSENYGRTTKTLKQAIGFCLAPGTRADRYREPAHYIGFRGGADGARGVIVSGNVAKGVLERVSAPTLQKLAFSNMTQALLFCEQADTRGTEWQGLTSSVRFLARNPRLSTPRLIDHFLIRSVHARFPQDP